MKRQRLLPWIFLLALVLVVVFSAGVKRGAYVEKENTQRQLQAQKMIPTKTPAPSPTIMVSFAYTRGPCNVQYLLPSFVASESAKIQIECDTKSASSSANLTKQGYTRTPVPQSNPLFYVWAKIPASLEKLVKESLQAVEK